jgi:NAD(P)-dependent dehydrogenase (short-subunit alcohol dehydrogenase family)
LAEPGPLHILRAAEGGCHGTLDGKVAIITGGNSGIGATIAQLFACKGASVVIAARRVAESDAVAGRIGSAASFFPTDVTVERDVAALVRHAVERFGRLDCLVNNAGNPGVMSGIRETEAAHWDNVVAVHVRGASRRRLIGRPGGR